MNKIVMMMGLVVMGLNVHAGEIIQASELPKAVMTAAKTVCPEGTVHQLESKGNDVYEVEMRIGEKTCDMKFHSDGRVIEVEREVSLTEMPKKVQQTLALYANIKIIHPEHVQKGADVFYEAEVEIDGHVYGFEIEKDGMIRHMKLEK